MGESFRLEPDAGVQAPSGLLRINPRAAADNGLVQARTVTVVGVARDVPGLRFTGIKEAGVFLPTGLDVEKTSMVARVQGEPNLARQALLDRLTKIDPNMGTIITMRSVASTETFFLQTAFWVSLMLGGLALLLTVSGLFSVLSYLVEQRTREIGVRMALGARSADVTAMVLRQGLRTTLVGIAVGLMGSFAAAHTIQSLLFGVVPTDPLTFVAVAALLVTVAGLACYLPARRAAKVDPLAALRCE